MGKFPKDEIEKLVRRIKYEDWDAFKSLFDIKSENLQKLACSYLRDEMLAEDVVSDVFYELLKKRGQFKNEKNLNGWLNVVTINKSLNILKKRKREKLVEDAQVLLDVHEVDNLEQIHINDCLMLLDEDERQAILYQHYGYKLREIRKFMDLTINELIGLLERARKKFKDFYKN